MSDKQPKHKELWWVRRPVEQGERSEDVKPNLSLMVNDPLNGQLVQISVPSGQFNAVPIARVMPMETEGKLTRLLELLETTPFYLITDNEICRAAWQAINDLKEILEKDEDEEEEDILK